MYISILVLVTLLSQYLSACTFGCQLSILCFRFLLCYLLALYRRIVKSLNLRSQTLSLNPKTKQMNKKSHS